MRAGSEGRDLGSEVKARLCPARRVRLADLCQLWRSTGVWAAGPSASLVVAAAGERIAGLAVAASLGLVLGSGSRSLCLSGERFVMITNATTGAWTF